jgi:nitrite reductase/ring-hydroxylating ferredoxin subunit
MAEHAIPRSDVDESDRVVYEFEGREISVFNVDGEYYAYLNWCAHQGGPVCEGPVTGTVEATFDRETLDTELEYVREDEILNCPWHGWEYDIETGECLSRQGALLPSYPVEVTDDELIISL